MTNHEVLLNTVDIPEVPETPQAAHLREDIVPLMASIGTTENFTETTYADLPATDIDFYSDTDDLDRAGIMHDGYATYVISPVSREDKKTSRLRNCTGLAVIGVDAETGENVSFLTHQSTGFTGQRLKNIITAIAVRLGELKARCENDTVEVVLFGGNYVNSHPATQVDYSAMVDALSEQVIKVLGFELTVIVGPKIIPGSDAVLLDTKHRRLYFSRSSSEQDNTSFLASALSDKREEWGG